MCNVILHTTVRLVTLAADWLLVNGDVVLYQMLYVVMIMYTAVHLDIDVRLELESVLKVWQLVAFKISL